MLCDAFGAAGDRPCINKCREAISRYTGTGSGGPRLIPNTEPAQFDWAHRGEVGNDNGYRYSLFTIFDYEVLKYSERLAWSGHRIVIALARSRLRSTAIRLFNLPLQESKLIRKL
ncbi:hypothetical protein G5I_08409 [Acromyrmex echinatior]|uniref:Uncharacterized protein n=1 Tax=Acromyrmex echinatior TaxID=103372 RepID=F4WRF9_ACREC|nr:hypothetical protein G5I_08409 [Acromyrmex echinatior]